MKLLLPVDGSTASIHAAKKAFEIAKKDGYTIKVISVVVPDNIQNYFKKEELKHRNAFGAGQVFPEYNKDNLDFCREKTSEILDCVIAEANAGGIPFEKEVLIGEPFEEIIKTAKIGAFDLIVIGNRGFSKIKRLFVGSVTNRVISESPCPVLVIPAETEE